jgi:hypothetical protein
LCEATLCHGTDPETRIELLIPTNTHFYTCAIPHNPQSRSSFSPQAGDDFVALEAASLELGRVSDQLDKLSDRWMELAELAGDL